MIAMDSRDYYRSQPGCGKATFQIMGGGIIPIAKGKQGWEVLVQVRENGEIGAIGGASNVYVDEEMNLLGFEPEEDTIRREFFEETGKPLDETDWKYICNSITINHYSKYPDVHGVGNFFYVISTHQKLLDYSKHGSNEGKIIIITLQELQKALDENRVFSNPRKAFENLLKTSRCTWRWNLFLYHIYSSKAFRLFKTWLK